MFFFPPGYTGTMLEPRHLHDEVGRVEEADCSEKGCPGWVPWLTGGDPICRTWPSPLYQSGPIFWFWWPTCFEHHSLTEVFSQTMAMISDAKGKTDCHTWSLAIFTYTGKNLSIATFVQSMLSFWISGDQGTIYYGSFGEAIFEQKHDVSSCLGPTLDRGRKQQSLQQHLLENLPILLAWLEARDGSNSDQ